MGRHQNKGSKPKSTQMPKNPNKGMTNRQQYKLAKGEQKLQQQKLDNQRKLGDKRTETVRVVGNRAAAAGMQAVSEHNATERQRIEADKTVALANAAKKSTTATVLEDWNSLIGSDPQGLSGTDEDDVGDKSTDQNPSFNPDDRS